MHKRTLQTLALIWTIQATASTPCTVETKNKQLVYLQFRCEKKEEKNRKSKQNWAMLATTTQTVPQ